MAKTSTRKLFLFGRYSLALLLPKKWLRELGVEAGESVQLELDRTRKRIVLRLTPQSHQNQSVTPARKAHRTRKPEDPNWSPIPQL